MRYMLRSLGVPVNGPMDICGENLEMIISSTNLELEMKNNHMEISYQELRESAADRIVNPIKVCTTVNRSEIMMKITLVGTLGSLYNA